MTRTFVDANILISAFRGQQEISEKAMRVLEDPNREFLASDFLRLEVLPKPVYEGREQEAEFYEAFFAGVTEIIFSSQSVVAEAEEEAKTAGLSAVDALHVTAAKRGKADEFITGEKATKPLFRVQGLYIHSLFGMS